jgi:exonuclease III
VTLNINGLYAGNKLRMLNEFIIRYDTDILSLQEVVTADFYPIPGYTIHINTGAERRGTATVIRDWMPLDVMRYHGCWVRYPIFFKADGFSCLQSI